MQQQQQNTVEPGQSHNNSGQRGPFPWKRVLVFFGFFLVLGLLAVITLLATGHIINYIWFYIAPVSVAFILSLVPILQWLFPMNPVGQSADVPSSSQQQIASSPITLTQTSVIPTPVSTVLSPPTHPPAQIFHVAQPLPSPDEFYGRAYEHATLINRTSQRSSTALVGEHRIGKSWLMQYLQQIAPVHAQLGPQVRIGKLSATHAQCQTLTGFVKKALEALNVPVHKPPPHETPLERLAIEVSDMKKQSIIPVLCIDEFAGLIGRPGFGKSFIEGLRAIAEDDGLVLVTASREPLHTVIEHMTGATSPLFNIMPELTLQPFTEAEAKMFISAKGQQGGLSEAEQALFLACVAIPQVNGSFGWPPLRLQLAGQLLLADKYPLGPAQRVYAPSDPAYQVDFKKRLDEQYQAMVKH